MPELAEPRWLWLVLPLVVLAAIEGRRLLAARRVRGLFALGIRVLTLLVLVVALAGPLGPGSSRQVDVVFALDVSRSIDRETVDEGLGVFNRALEVSAPHTRLGLVAFGADAGVELLPRERHPPLERISVDVARSRTDIARALEAAVGAFPGGGGRRIVLLSDGRENAGRAEAAAAMARAVGVEVHAIALEPRRPADEVHMAGIVAPAEVRVHEPFNVEMLLHSARRVPAELVVMRNGAVVDTVRLDLQPGTNTYTWAEQASQAGLYEYEAIVNSAADAVQENNRYQAFVHVAGPPKVLHLVGEPGWGAAVTAGLSAQGLTVETLPGDALPATLHGLTDYDLIVLNNVSGFDMSLEKMRLLETYVRDAGGGLVTLGGDRSYSSGGYYATPVERALPVSMDVETQARIPSVSVTIVLDRSGSMASDEKLYIAKSAALAAIEVLNPLDEVSVLTFDQQAQWSVPPTRVANRVEIAAMLREVSSGGGTDLFGALAQARDATRVQSAKIKHVIVLSDGLTEGENDFEALVREIARNGVTVSTVAFGGDADQALLESIAAWGNGRFYFTDDPENVPRIFTSETLVVSRDLHVEKRIEPKVRFPGALLEGLDLGSLPPLEGYQRTFPKPTAQVLLSAEGEDPLLVSWRYGLGKSVAFMSDLAGRWGVPWIQWREFGRFLGQTARWAMRPRGGASLRPSFSWEAERGEVVVDVLDRDDRYVNGLAMRAVMVGPDRTPREVDLEQTAPGRYRGEFPVVGPGRYYTSLRGAGEGRQVGPRTFGFAVPYSPEFLAGGVDRERLRELARIGGGALIEPGEASLRALLAPGPAEAAASTRVLWPLLVAALVLLLAETAVRKVPLPASWRRQVARPEAAEPGYAAWRDELAAARAAHLESMHHGRTFESDDPAVRARLHMARARGR